MTINPKGQSYGQTRQTWADKLTIKRRMHHTLKMVGTANLSNKGEIHVLELGCGYHGSNLIELMKYYPEFRCLGVDRVVKPGSSTKNFSLLPGDITTWQPQNPADIVLSLAVIEHLPDPGQHLRMISQALKPGGIAVLTTPTPATHALWSILGKLHLIDTSAGNIHMLYLTQQGVKVLAEQTGLKVISEKLFEFGLNQIILLEKLL